MFELNDDMLYFSSTTLITSKTRTEESTPMALSLARSLLADQQFAENMKNPAIEVEFRLGQVARASNVR